MNELKATINFTKQTFVINGVDLISGDYNSTKITFNFEDYKEGTKILEIRPKDSEDKNPTFMSEIINNEVILVSKDSEEHSISPFTDGGVYLLEVSVYGNDSKLSTITKSINVLSEQIILSDDIVTPYLPIFDELIQEINTAITETNNLNISITKVNGVATITLTKKDGTTNTVTIRDGIDGVGIESISKISTSGLIDTYRITLTNNTYYDYQVVNGMNGTDGRGISSITKTSTSGLVDTYTITYTDGTTSTFEVTNGEDGEVTQAQLDALQREVNYNSLYANALAKMNNSGTSLTINDTAEAPMPMSLAPSELEQATTTGKNKLPILDGTITINGITITVENGIVNINGTSTGGLNIKLTNGLASSSGSSLDNDWLSETCINDKNNTTISINYISGTGATSGCAFRVYDETTSYLNQYYPFTSLQTTTYNESGKISCVAFFTGSGRTFDNYKFTLQLEDGTTATDFEKFTYGASPNPNYPQDIHTISGNNTIKIENKNYLPIILEGGTINGTTGINQSGSSSVRTPNYINISSANNWLFTRDTDTTNIRCRYYDKDYNYLGSDPQIGRNLSYTIEKPQNAVYLRLAIDVANLNYITDYKCQLKTSFQEQILQLNLGDLEYCKIGDYEDEFYLATESDTGLTAGKWYLKKNTIKRTINSLSSKDYNSTYNYFYGIASDMYVETSANVLFKGFSKIYERTTSKGNADWGSKPDYVIGTRQTTAAICFKDSNYTNKTDFFNARGNEEIYYVLATPEYILLNNTLQEELDNIYNWVLSYQDQTNISQTNTDLPFVISATTCYDLNKLLTRVEVLESEV